MKSSFIFPGQGSQKIGMGKEVHDSFRTAREVFEEVDDVLSQKLSKLIFYGPMEELTLTENSQPALMAVSIALTRVLIKDLGFNLCEEIGLVAGHSLGEYSALCAIDAISLDEVSKLLRIRGKSMQDAVPLGHGGMAALIGADFEVVSNLVKLVAQNEICEIANDNAPGQIVISGNIDAIDRAIEQAKTNNVPRAIKLPVSAPFHCSLMDPAASIMKDFINNTDIKMRKVNLVSNVTAVSVNSSDEIKRLLIEQITSVVRWRESILYMQSRGIEKFVEIGSGNVLSGLIRRINKKAKAMSINSPEDLDELSKTL